ncbi:MAG: hypothetical protein ACLQQ4_16415 [Bacteroidia bacterium]
MKRILLSCIIAFSSFATFAQDASDRHMAFYGVDDDTTFHKRDSIFRIDSSHITIFGSVATAFNSGMGGLVNSDGYAYNSSHVTPGIAFGFGFNYLSKILRNHWFFTLGFEASRFGCSGVLNATPPAIKGSSSPEPDTSSYNITVYTLDVPFKMYYCFLDTKKCRLSAGAGISIGLFISQMNSETNENLGFNLSNPVNLGSLSLRFDFAVSKHFWLSLEPFYSIQMLSDITHIESAGVKLELL